MNFTHFAYAPQLPPCRVLGAGFFAPSYDSVHDALAGQARPTRRAPGFSLVAGRLRRFTSLLTQMQIEAAGAALADAGVAPTDVVPLFASEFGETATSLELLGSIEDQGLASAARFAQSVHSTSSGLFSIATGNQHPTYAVALGEATFLAAVLEARLLAAEHRAPVLLCAADDALPAVLPSVRPGVALAAAFVLTVDQGAGEPMPSPSTGTAPAHLRGSSMWEALNWLEALRR